MANENEAGNSKEAEKIESVGDEIEIEEGQEDSAEFWKAEALKNHGIAKRYQTKFQKAKEAEETKKTEAKNEIKEDKTSEKKSDELDYGQKAYLAANDVKASDEVNLVKAIMKDTGKTLEQVLESKYFQAELKEMRELKNTANATPSKTGRSSNSAKDSVEYWIAKGELPPEDQIALRRQVIAERRKKDNQGNPYRISK
jgi:hypothetical protein